MKIFNQAKGMKTILASIFAMTIIGSQAQVTDTVSTGAGYANQKWYSLQNDEQGTAQPKDNWDIAFEITGQAASIIGNTQKANFIIYKAPYNITQFSTIDTSGIKTWQEIYNADTSWSLGAFNKGADPSNDSDLGWGFYDMNTHYINGDSCYVIKLSATSFKKIKFDNLANGTYNFNYADLDGSNLQTKAIAKSSYVGKNFAYYDLTNNLAIDREPLAANWDFTFTKYTTFIPTAYGVTGIVSNKGVKVAQANNIGNAANYTNYAAHTFGNEINIIGYDWKSFNGSTYVIEDSLVYFVSDRAGNIWSVIPTGFAGSTTGDYVFSKKLLKSTGIVDAKEKTGFQFVVYPNPSNGNDVNIVYDINNAVNNSTLNVSDLTGKTIYTSPLNTYTGLHTFSLNNANLNAGIYIVKVELDGKQSTQKLIIE